AFWLVSSWLTSGRHRAAMAQALGFVEPDMKLPPPLAAAIHRAAGEFFVRERDAAKALEHFRKSRALLMAQPVDKAEPSPERDALLIDLALAQVGLGGSEDEVIDKARISWEEAQSEIIKTLRQIGVPDAQLIGVREVCTRLLAREKGDIAGSVA